MHYLLPADSTLIWMADDRLVMMDYAHQGNADNPSDKRCDLPKEVKDAMDDAGQDSFSAVAFTHLDDDHICKATEFFWLEHTAKYQGGNLDPKAPTRNIQVDLDYIGRILLNWG